MSNLDFGDKDSENRAKYKEKVLFSFISEVHPNFGDYCSYVYCPVNLPTKRMTPEEASLMT